MKNNLLLGAFAAVGSLCLQGITFAHGGTYRGPGDTVPAGGGGGGGGGASPTGPGASGPSTGGPAGPSTPAPGGPGVPTGGGGGRPAGPSTGDGSSGADLTTWDFWWGFNKDQYLNLKAAIYNGVITGSDDFFMGQGTKGQAKNQLKPSEEAIRQKIVPALKEALEKERSNDIVTGCLIGLAKIGDVKSESGASEFEPLLSKFLSDGNQEIAETAAVALGILANDASIKTLSDLALDTPAGRKLVGNKEINFRSRAFATYGLGLIGYRTASNQVRQDIAAILIDILNKPESSTRDVKVAALVSLGLVPIDVDKSESPDSKQSFSSSRQTEIKFIEKFFKEENNNYLIRAHAPAALARLLNAPPYKDAPPDLKEGVAKMLLGALGKQTKERDEVRQGCVLALGQIGDTDKDKTDVEIRETLKRMAEEGDQQSRNFSMISLGQIGGRAGAGEDSDKGVKECRDDLLTFMTKGKNAIKPWAGLGIGVMERSILDNSQGGLTPSSTAKDTLRTTLKEASSPSHMGAYSIACGIAKDTEAKDLLREKLKNAPGDEVKGNVAVALGLIDAREAIKDIEEIVKDSKYKPDLLKQAAIGLGLLGDKDLVPEMVKMLAEAKGYSSQAAIASALGFIGDSRSIDPLVEMLKRKDITDSARGFAAVALGIVADKETLPWNSKISTNINYRANTTTLTGEATGILDIL
jgi:HEAT repeat protein